MLVTLAVDGLGGLDILVMGDLLLSDGSCVLTEGSKKNGELVRHDPRGRTQRGEGDGGNE